MLVYVGVVGAWGGGCVAGDLLLYLHLVIMDH